ncbi:efflux RND transporter periplasmic adaptor subunit [Rhizobium bangladeshense]|uniref:efflux RND transporter periplasmic adaptor subunit n=1 Tax=Rhizobium bangladeshense TaxID=1138189 RepID=UPI001A9802B1|nr:efflux RND transporter periplasmic adaptor subunit [Rhizobium bangladeshense]MBX4935646.1 efflux RND transporter periplasmic adaptor subunit [Rhizobium bangladeshense]MBY3584723.1 efflux RND transporter periplasmic adaptor subunit [Rhizobium bangladeshense]QSY92223.1 efflux RND transporter periplasmic adaptor subunit [Rhizobium bangladeshense]
MRKPSRLFAAAVVAAALVSPLRNAMADKAAATALTVSLTAPAQRDWPETVPASGWLKPWQEAVIASETSGLRITDVLVDVGSVVTKGQTLVRLSQESVLADLRKQEAAVATAKASLSKAKANADRARQLQPSGALSDEKIVDYLADEQTATASLASEEAALDSEKIKLAQTTITAIDDGLITSRSADLGAVVSAGTELFRMVRQQRVEWQAEVSSRYLPRISQGLSVKVNGPEGHAIEGKVRLVGPSVSTDTSRAIVYVTLPVDARPRTGLYITGDIELETSPALTVPETAIVFRDGISYVFTAGDDHRVQRVRVETGRRNNGEVEIVSGMDRTSKVVTSGGAFLSDNDLVKIAEKS